MTTLIIGASSKTSIGYLLGQHLKKNKHKIFYASRSGNMGARCDINQPKEVRSLLNKYKPDIIINAAGTFSIPNNIGEYKTWNNIKEHIIAKSFGNLVLLDSSIKSSRVYKIILFGGRELSQHPGFAAYSMGNGAMNALVNFAKKHTQTDIYYIDLPLVRDTSMANLYSLTKKSDKATPAKEQSTNIQNIAFIIEDILDNKYKRGSRIVLEPKATL